MTTTRHLFTSELLNCEAVIEASWTDGVVAGTTCKKFRFFDSLGKPEAWIIYSPHAERMVCMMFEATASKFDKPKLEMCLRYPGKKEAA